ncbi:hypothetical protein BV25DRAFT_1906451 [Artomyces pyxidatus]|uniref:Uncharacterized protein n=1 Tax=Artomyces pyxidatus TaxID=48021 RepID=A0ACB8T934_9AGAM|nr:hypothetical protein BV25DRAFT_1906451 [Artomyces pyxidatus]
MATAERVHPTPQDLVAIFHASFHPTQGNIVDWSLKATDDVHLDGVEFSSLPSGLHLVEQDVLYFTNNEHHGVAVFKRRKTTELGHRGFRLSSLGILLAKSAKPRPWRHVPTLRTLVTDLYKTLEEREVLEPRDEDWDPARKFFDERKVRPGDLDGTQDWKQWSQELDGADVDSISTNPTLHLPHLLRMLGPSCLTLYKHILGRRRVLIYSHPPLEGACILCQVAADICYEDQVGIEGSPDASRSCLTGKHKEGVNVLGIVTLHDIEKLAHETKSGRGWVACTSDAIFLERPQYYDLIIDLTTSMPARGARPSLYISRPHLSLGSRGPNYRLSTVRFTWSDVKLWTELDRLLQLDVSSGPDDGPGCGGTSGWSEMWRLYEDVCVVCAGFWSNSWRGSSSIDDHRSEIRLEGGDELHLRTVHVRTLGSGIEGRPMPGAFREPPSPATTSKAMRRSSGMSLWSLGGRNGRAETSALSPASGASTKDLGDDGDEDDGVVVDIAAVRDRQLLTTLALLQTFHAHTVFLRSRLATLIPPPEERSDTIVSLSPKDVMSLDLGPLSSLDAKFLEWLAEEYGGGAQITVRKGWRDLFGLMLGFGD